MEKEKALKLIFNTYGSFKYNFKRVIVFEIIYKLITFAIFLPLIGGIFRYFMGSAGKFSLANKEFLRFALTPVGFLCIVILVFFAFLIIFFEIGVLVYIGAASHSDKKVTLSEAVFNTFRIIPKLLNRNIVPLTFLTGIIGPITGIGLCSTLIRSFTIPPFVTIELSKTLGGKILYNGLIIL
ncbi:MAG: glycerophosphoryl diester phosphodiesterase membrane domain-containing protein, partial [Clostridium sp.]